jgi:flagellar biosynthetic protein FliS
MSHDAARNYRLQTAEFAGPVGVIVQAYEQVIRALHEAGRAADQGKIELKTEEVNRALAITGHLEAMLDHEAGPKVANKLEVFYATMRYQIIKASAQPSGDSLREVSKYFATLQEAWRVVERDHPALPAGAAPAPRGSAPVQPSTDFPTEPVPSTWNA